jgi:hypothetical protein
VILAFYLMIKLVLPVASTFQILASDTCTGKEKMLLKIKLVNMLAFDNGTNTLLDG